MLQRWIRVDVRYINGGKRINKYIAQIKDMSKNTIVGFRPSGRLHLGHYVSVIKPAIEYKADILIAKHHAPLSESEYEEQA